MTGSPRFYGRRARALAAALVVALLAIAGVLGDAARRRGADEERRAMRSAVVRVLGTPDLALSSSSRWLRHPSQAEPGAPFADAPGMPDPDPAGGVIAPPREILRIGAPEVRAERRSR